MNNHNIFSKELFIETINEIQNQYDHDDKCSKAFATILSNDYTSCYDNHWLMNSLIKIIKIAMNDKDDWTDYYIWELNFGRKWKKGMVLVKNKDFKLQNADDLWNLIQITQ